ncbi:MAG: DUF2029 domain-containing protein [Selenomonadaceae bacterium]|nr:DUF2029 domain-containing protein [Selenomonadaceae bacterium]
MRNDKLNFAMGSIIVIFNVLTLYLMRALELPWYDFAGHRRICAYTLNGFDPYLLVGVDPPPLEEIGVIPQGWGTSPWGLILGNFFYPGYLSFDIAANYFVILNVLLLIITSLIFYVKFKNFSDSLGGFTLLTFLCSATFFVALTCGNSGGMICCLLLISCAIYKEFPIVAGVLISLAMVKPQVAIPICFWLLLRKNFKVIITAAVIDLSAWLIASLLIKKSPLMLLNEFFHCGVGDGGQFAGIFHLAFDNLNTAMLFSMLAGIIYMLIMNFLIDDRTPEIFSIYPACIASSFWCYSFFCDLYILILPAFMCMFIMKFSKELYKKIFWFILGLYSQLALTFWISIALINDLNKYTIFKSLFDTEILKMIFDRALDKPAHTSFEVGMIIIGFLICYELQANYSNYFKRRF